MVVHGAQRSKRPRESEQNNNRPDTVFIQKNQFDGEYCVEIHRCLDGHIARGYNRHMRLINDAQPPISLNGFCRIAVIAYWKHLLLCQDNGFQEELW